MILFTPSISLERLKLETSNFACRLTTKGSNKKMKIRSKGVVKESSDLLVEFWDPRLYILGTVEDKNFEFFVQIHHKGSKSNKK